MAGRVQSEVLHDLHPFDAAPKTMRAKTAVIAALAALAQENLVKFFPQAPNRDWLNPHLAPNVSIGATAPKQLQNRLFHDRLGVVHALSRIDPITRISMSLPKPVHFKPVTLRKSPEVAFMQSVRPELVGRKMWALIHLELLKGHGHSGPSALSRFRTA